MTLDKNLDYYTIQEVADLLRVEHRSVRRYIKRGMIKAIKLSQNIVRIPREEIEHLLK